MSEGRPTIWVTRPLAQSEPLLAALARAGYDAVAVPTLVIDAVASSPHFIEQTRHTLAAAQIAIFISRNAVDWLWYQLGEETATCLDNCRVLAVGPGTAAALAAHGCHDVLQPATGADSEALLSLPALAAPTVSDRPVAIVRGVGGSERLAKTLAARGAQVSYIEVYQRLHNRAVEAQMSSLWRDRPPAAIVVTSLAGLEALLAMTPSAQQTRLLATPLVCLGQRLPQQALARGFAETWPAAAVGGDDAIISALQQNLGPTGIVHPL